MFMVAAKLIAKSGSDEMFSKCKHLLAFSEYLRPE